VSKTNQKLPLRGVFDFVLSVISADLRRAPSEQRVLSPVQRLVDHAIRVFVFFAWDMGE
jgi:hypothetical protein